MSPDTVRRRLVVHGRVQGVFFRDATRRQARRAGVSGHARNLEDGTVEVILEGSAAAVGEVAAFLRSGPPRARVDRVESFAEEPEGLSGFETG